MRQISEADAERVRDLLLQKGQLKAFFHHSTGRVVYVPTEDAVTLNSADYTPLAVDGGYPN